jgi:hypothetical protein
MDRPPPDPAALLQYWMEWEKAEATPGEVMSNLKKYGMREMLEGLADAATSVSTPADDGAPAPSGADA